MSTRNHIVNWHLVGLLGVIGLLLGCSGKYTYPNTLAKNLHIQTETESGSFFSSVRAAVGIYRVDDHCRIEYQGSVALDERPVSVGIPSGRPSYLVFEFVNSSFLANSRRSISYETLLIAVTGREYDIKVSYLDDIYNVEIREFRPGDAVARNIERKELQACRFSLKDMASVEAAMSRVVKIPQPSFATSSVLAQVQSRQTQIS